VKTTTPRSPHFERLEPVIAAVASRVTLKVPIKLTRTIRSNASSASDRPATEHPPRVPIRRSSPGCAPAVSPRRPRRARR